MMVTPRPPFPPGRESLGSLSDLLMRLAMAYAGGRLLPPTQARIDGNARGPLDHWSSLASRRFWKAIRMPEGHVLREVAGEGDNRTHCPTGTSISMVSDSL
jgi:hypothetical protein